MPWDTGLRSLDAESDFQRARRRQVLAQLARRLRGEPDDINLILPFDEVVAAVGRTGERPLGLQTIELRSIVGSVDRTADFDRRFRPTSNRLRQRWQGINEAQRSGRGMPPISVYRVGDLHYVRDGHHRVSVALALGNTVIEAYVTEVMTQIPAAGISDRGDIVVKGYERLFHQRVPLPEELAARIVCRDPWNYAELSENVEAWSFRLVQDAGEYLSRAEAAGRWYDEEYRPVVAMLHEADLIGRGTEAEAYLRIACDRYRLIRAHQWSDEIIARLRG
ncbi:MAG TPA: hypothetical protein VHI30_08140 [Gaiellales bacterium]|jgi:hypothetical protein|nr:hypothetical protein [Gaiellales bacterium]